jgi:predicted nucleotidyltransferase
LRSVEECYRGHNVRVFRLDRAAILERLRERARRLLAADDRVVEVRLFGSLARDAAHPGSDADLFVVVRDGAEDFLARIPPVARHFTGVGIGCDVIVFTQSELAALVTAGDRFATAVLNEGMSLARRESA